MSLDCMKQEFVSYLNNVFNSQNVRVASFLNFRKNDIDYSAWRSATSKNKSEPNSGGEDADDELEGTSARAANPLEEVTKSVQDKIKEFFVTHDVQLALPEFVAEGASVRISPRAFQDGGALIKLDLTGEAEERSSSVGTPRIFFKKISEYFLVVELLEFIYDTLSRV